MRARVIQYLMVTVLPDGTALVEQMSGTPPRMEASVLPATTV